MGVVVVEVLHGLLLFATLLVEEVCRDVVEVNKFDTSIGNHFAIPLAIGVVAALNLAILPFVTRCQRYQNRCGTLFTDVLNEFLQIPAEGVNHLVGPYLGVGL